MAENGNPCKKPGNQDISICEELVRIFGNQSVDAEWDVCTGTTDDMTGSEGERERYCPVVDYVVGPFNVSDDDNVNRERNDQYDDLLKEHEVLFRILFGLDRSLEEEKVRELGRNERRCLNLLYVERENEPIFNQNPRCFLAIEIENTTQEKHVLGGLVNASGLGKIGILVTPIERYKARMKIRRYLRFLVAVKKLGDSVTLGKNTILLPRDIFLQILTEYRAGLKEFILSVLSYDEYFKDEHPSWYMARTQIVPQLIDEFIDGFGGTTPDIGGDNHGFCEDIVNSLNSYLISRRDIFENYDFENGTTIAEFGLFIRNTIRERLWCYRPPVYGSDSS